MSIESTSSVAQSAEVLNQVLQAAQASQAELARKLIEASLSVALSMVSADGVGENIDVQA
jgi:hypothetical protein